MRVQISLGVQNALVVQLERTVGFYPTNTGSNPVESTNLEDGETWESCSSKATVSISSMFISIH